MTRLRLREVRYQCDFRKSDVRLLEELYAEEPEVLTLAPRETFLFVSIGMNQLLWVLNSRSETRAPPASGFVSPRRRDVSFTDTRRWRFVDRGEEGGALSSWDPLAIRLYAQEVGITLLGMSSIGAEHAAYDEERRAWNRERQRLYRERKHSVRGS